jgi:hypothetical protein
MGQIQCHMPLVLILALLTAPWTRAQTPNQEQFEDVARRARESRVSAPGIHGSEARGDGFQTSLAFSRH